MRFLVVLSVALATLTGCPLSRSDELASPGSDDDGMGSNGGGLPQAFCLGDTECELAAASCCECPTFASNRNDPTNGACTGVACPTPPVCPANVRAACDLDKHECTVACVELACQTACPDGYAIDPVTGCLSCECAAISTLGACSADTDCVETREDCCGCARGGSDTAIPAAMQGAYEQMLGCSAYPQCPGLDTCDPAAEPRCVQGNCLLTDAVLPPNACTGTCAGGGTCTVNHDPGASTLGVGVCVSP